MGELQEFIRVVRHRILIIGLLTMLGFGAAALWVFRSPAEYVATTRLFISGATATSQYDAQQGGVYAQERVVSYEKLVNSRALAQRTIDALHLDMDAGTLATRVTSTSFPDAAVMDVSVTADSPKTARDITNGLANQFIELASDLETPPDGAAPVVRLTVVDQAEDGTAARILPAKLIYIFGGLVGLIAGLIIAFVWENCSRRIRDGADVSAATGEHVLADLPASRTEILLNSRAEANEATARLRVSIAAVNGSIPHTLALASVPTSKDLARRFTAQAGLNLVDALVAEKRKAVLLVLDSSHDIKVRITRYARKTRKKTDRLIPVQWGFDDDQQGNPPLDREAIAQRLEQLKTAYEFVIVVLPPLSRFAYAAAVVPVVDGVVAVGIYHQTRNRDLEEHMAEIHRTGATSMGFAFARRTLVPWPSTETATEPTVVSVSPPRGADAGAGAGRKQSGQHTSGREHRNSENGDSPIQALDLTLR
jgi:capsular polysaccharide biosynthesis protein